MENAEPKTSREKGRSWPSVLMATLFVLTIIGVAIFGARQIPIADHFLTDADTIRESLDAADTRQILWQPPEPLADVINTAADDYEPRISADGLTLYFVRGKAGGAADIYTSTRVLNGWTDPKPLSGVNSPYNELGPEPSPNAQSLYFYSDRPGGSGGYDLWVAHRIDDGWQTPINLGPAVNSEYNDYGISLTPGGDSLYFASNRPEPQVEGESDAPDPRAWSATLREDLYRHDYDLYLAPITESGVGEAKALAVLNTPYNDGAPAVSSFGDFLYFSSDRTGGEGGFDVYRCRRLGDTHSSAENLGPSINTPRHELDPGLSLGGYALYFSSDRPMASENPTTAAGKSQPKYNLFYTTSREVFTHAEYHQRPRIDWAALWRAVGPNLLWALLALLLILSMLALFGGIQGRRLSLLAKCLLGSVTAHLLLLLIFNVWEVTSSLAREFQRRGKIQIALASPSTADDLARQIHGDITEVDAPSAQTMNDQRQEPELEVEVQSTMADVSVQQQTLDMPDDPTIDIPARDTTIERQVESPQHPENIASDSALAKLDTKLPAVPQRVESPENRPADQMQHAPVETVTRASAREPVTYVRAAVAEMTPDSRAGNAQASAAEQDSIAGAAPMYEATPDAVPISRFDESMASKDRPTAPPILLSHVPAEHMPKTSEAAPTTTSIIAPTPRHHLAQASPTTLTKHSLRRIRPMAAPTAQEDATLADRPSAVDAERDAALAWSDPLHAPSPDITAPRLTNFGLTAVEEPKIATNDPEAAEAPSLPTHVRGTELRHALSTAISSDQPKAAPVSVVPSSLPHPRDQRSLAPEKMRQSADATPARDRPETASVVPVVAALVDFGMANVAESKVATDGPQADEAPQSPIPMRGTELRHDLSTTISSDQPRAAAVSVAPSALSHPRDQRSLAPEKIRQSADANPARDRPETTSVTTVVAALADFGMANVEESKVPTDDPEAAEAPSPLTHVRGTELRHDLSAVISSDQPRAAAVSVAPNTLQHPRDERSFAPEKMRQSADATPARIRPDQTSAPTVVAELPDITALRLANVEQSKMVTNDAEAAEAPSPLTHVRGAELRHALSNAIALDNPKTMTVSVVPNAIPHPRNERSLAPERTRQNADATPVRSRRTAATAPTVATALPDIAKMALPDIAPASVDSESRTMPGVTPIRTDSTRAAFDRDVLPGASPSSMTWLDVPTQVRHKPDSSMNRLAAVTARDIEFKKVELLPPTFFASLPDITIPEFEAPKLDLPTELKPPTNAYAQRSTADRMDIVEQKGGSKETERAVADALRWLASHQSKDGRWSGDAFDDGCGECGGETEVVVDHALTGLSLLAFLGAGHTHETNGPYRDNVRRALRWLLNAQAADGDLRGDETMYSHGIATIALSEAYGMTGDATLVYAIQRAVEFIDRARNTTEGGWRYDPGQAGDTSVLGWQVMALNSAALNGIPVPIESLRAAGRWMDSVDQSSTPGLYAYRPDRRHTPSMTAEGMFVQQLLGVPRDDPRMRVSSEFVAQNPPDWESQPSTYYWYYATLALFQYQGNKWLSWNQALTRELLRHQRKDAAALGSWNPEGEWADVGGRVYQTAICALMLEVYYRYLPMYARDKTFDPIGAIRGHIADAKTGMPVVGATIRLDVNDRSSVSVVSDENGAYLLLSPDVPKYFALSASNPGYIPSTSNVAAATVKGTTFVLDFVIQPQNREIVAMESDPAVHHLGDDNYGGLINSRFQNKSEGSWYAAGFELDESQVGSNIAAAQIRVLVKGIQRRHRIRINGTVLERRLDRAPADGRFGEFTAEFDPSLLRAGKNEFEIIAKPSTSDIDDFEFVNVRIHLSLRPDA